MRLAARVKVEVEVLFPYLWFAYSVPAFVPAVAL